MYKLCFGQSVSATDSQQWNELAGGDNPFVSHEFLSSLEDSGCVGKGSGWLPFPILVTDEQDKLVGAAPCYIKLHSKGEYMFDYHWADAYHRLTMGELSYYPKLQVAVPFTPVPGPRLLVSSELSQEEQSEVQQIMLEALKDKITERDYSSAHITFCEADESQRAKDLGDFLPRTGEQYHWFNRGYDDFNDFLASLTSRKRKNIRREREKVAAHPVDILTVTGSQLNDEQLGAFFRMYEWTSMQKWGQPYLNLEFFKLLAERLKDRLVLFLVREQSDQKWIAGAWNLRGDSALFGRNWGCFRHYDLLHFEVCYYRAIEYAISNGLQKVEAGAQGMHKIKRGYQVRPVHSAHHIKLRPFRQAIADYLRAETQENEQRLDILKTLEPFRQRADL